MVNQVRALLGLHPETKDLGLQVEAVDGILTVTGTGLSAAIEAALASALQPLKGVTGLPEHHGGPNSVGGTLY